MAPYRIEYVDIPWNGTFVSGNLHLCPSKESAPLVFHIPGCDTLKEAWQHPFFNPAHQRGMHVFSFDGPDPAGNSDFPISPSPAPKWSLMPWLSHAATGHRRYEPVSRLWYDKRYPFNSYQGEAPSRAGGGMH